MKKRFANYKSYANATMEEVLTPEQRKGALRLTATNLQSCFLRNDGDGKFTMIPLPEEAQFSPINGMVLDDFDGDGNLDVLINGNDYATAIGIGRYDASNGLLLKGDGAGGFVPLSMMQSGVSIPGDGKALVKLTDGKNKYLVAASQNRGNLILFEMNKKQRIIRVNPGDRFAMLTFATGKIQKQELNQGSSFLSQSASFLTVGKNVTALSITDNHGLVRSVSFEKPK
jgi:hypothetical protein